jgi:hypothetical protein
MDISQFSGYLVFLAIFTMGFWLMLFLLTFIVPYWLYGNIVEIWKEKRAAKKGKV